MPEYHPNILFSDGFGSAGGVTWYHVNGKCYTRKKPKPRFSGTAAQLNQAGIHRRAMEAWRGLPPQTQQVWNKLGEYVSPHRPPFGDSSWITGQNLFVSAYHGFVTLGNEHIPEPQAFELFPLYSLSFSSASVERELLRLNLHCSVMGTVCPQRYRVLIRLQLEKQGAGSNPGKMRNFLAIDNCQSSEGIVSFIIPDYRARWGLDLPSYQAHCHCQLLDSKTGYRNNKSKLSFSFDLSKSSPLIK